MGGGDTAARSAGARASASTGGCEASARSAGAASICEHGRVRKQVQGVRGLEHLRAREAGALSDLRAREGARCKCGGSGICEHGRQRHSCKECGGSSICEHGRERNKCKECGGSGICEREGRRCVGVGHLRARDPTQLQGVRGLKHLRAREGAKQVQGVRGLGHLRAREGAKQVQGVRGLKHLRAREAAKHVQGVSRGSRGVRSSDPPPLPTQARGWGRSRDQTRAQRHVGSGRGPRRGCGARDQVRAQRRVGPGERRAVTPPFLLAPSSTRTRTV